MEIMERVIAAGVIGLCAVVAAIIDPQVAIGFAFGAVVAAGVFLALTLRRLRD